MRAFKTKWFARWASKEGLGDDALAAAVFEMEQGMIDANLGGQIVKKRVALPGRGKRGSIRTLVAYQLSKKVFFVYGFSKNVRTNITNKELRALKLLAEVLLNYEVAALRKATQAGELIEMSVNNDG